MKKWNIFALMVVTAVVLVVCSAGAAQIPYEPEAGVVAPQPLLP